MRFAGNIFNKYESPEDYKQKLEAETEAYYMRNPDKIDELRRAQLETAYRPMLSALSILRGGSE